ncbi:MAG: 4-hydroxybenzoate polyprenyltransferase [Patiriisocius sp.]|jgi:4-hydroxybenzoate polyprenyltransferase
MWIHNSLSYLRSMKSFISIIRLPNLLVMALSMIMVRYCLFLPLLKYNNIKLEQESSLFFLLVISIILLAAGGNIINDLKDVESDKINKPGKNKIPDNISFKRGNFLYYLMTSAGLIIGFISSYLGDIPILFTTHIFIGLSLWVYSNKLNHIPLVGNALIAALLALLPWIVFIFDFPSIILAQQIPHNTFSLYEGNIINFQTYFSLISILVLAYSLFVYLQNIAREIIKDVVDLEGDKLTEYRTIPSVYGIKMAKRIIRYSMFFLIGLYLLFALFVHYFLVSDNIILYLFFLFSFLAPLIYSIKLLRDAREKIDFIKLSNFNKLSQLIGLISMLYFYLSYS